jgi:anthraniloyl-CoA monooxygenase
MMQAMRAADPESAEQIANAFNHWDDIELIFKGTRQRTTGHGFIGIERKQMLNILQRRCEELGIELAFEQNGLLRSTTVMKCSGFRRFIGRPK